MRFILSLQSANPSPTKVLESKEPVGSVQKWIIAPPYCGGRLMIKIMKMVKEPLAGGWIGRVCLPFV